MNRYYFWLYFIFFFSARLLLAIEPFNIKDIRYPLDISFSMIHTVEDANEQTQLYHFLVESYVNQSLIDRAFLVIQSLPKSKLALSVPLYKTLFVTFYEQHDAKSTISLINKLDATIRPHIIEACFQHSLEQSKIKESLIFFNAVESPIILSRFCNLLVTYFVNQNNLEEALIYHDLIKLPSEKEKSLAELSILFTKEGDITSINKALDSITNLTYKQTLLLNVVKTLVELNKIDIALNFLEQIQKSPIYEKALTHVIAGLIRNDNFSEAIKLAQQLETDFHKHEAMILLGSGFAQSANLEAIKELQSNIESVDVKNKFIQNVTIELANNEFIQEAFNLSKLLPIPLQNDHYSSLIKHIKNYDNISFMILLIKQINNYHIINTTLGDYAIQLASVNNHNDVTEILKAITDPAIQESTVLTILINQDTMNNDQHYQPFITDSITLDYITYLNQHHLDLIPAEERLQRLHSKCRYKTLSTSQKITYNIEKGLLYIKNNQPNQATKLAKKAYKLAKKAKSPLSINTLTRYLLLESQLNRSNTAINIIKKQVPYHSQKDILYLFGSLKNHEKLSHKKLTSFAKDFKK